MSTVVVAGALASKAGNGGEAWVRLSYVLGLRKLGYETRFVEQAEDPSPAAVAYFEDVTTRFGVEASLLDRNGRPLVGSPVEGADLLINISGNLRSKALRDRFRRTAFVDIDPGFTQFWHVQGLDPIPRHHVYFTIAENIGTGDCSIPTGGIPWRPTRAPVLLDQWTARAYRSFDRFTTVASWRCPFGRIDHYGLKHHEWRRFARLPTLTNLPFEAVLRIDPQDAADQASLEDDGWSIVDPTMAADVEGVHSYIRSSGAEFSVAQGIYVETKSGWFSDRSVRYLASGVPVLVQDTGFGKSLPIGDGLLSFRGLADAAAAARRMVDDHERHARAARAIAEEYFDSDKVLAAMLEDVL
jgi:hypothetical protein